MDATEVKRIRQKLGRSQRDLDYLLNMSSGSVKRWESGQSKCGVKGTAEVLLKLLDKRPELVLDIRE
jgi:putative transcriptional regulator